MANAPSIMEQTDPAVLQEQYQREQAQGGGPGMEGDPNAQTPANAAASSTAQNPPKYKTFGREFDSAEDLQEYTKELERQNVDSRLMAERAQSQANRQNVNTLQNTQHPAAAVPAEGPGVDELLFTDPKKAVTMLKQQARDDVMKELNAKEAEHQFWKSFYDENPDLLNADRIVKSIVKEKWSEVANLPLAEAKRLLAGETRGIVEKLRAPVTRKELSQTSASSLPASGASAPIVAAAQGEPESFTAQIKSFQRKRKH